MAKWKQRLSAEEQFVFCHCDLSQDNILVNPQTLQIVAVIDWEYGGFFPQGHEIPFYESSKASGLQLVDSKNKQKVDKVIEFWRESQISGDPTCP